MHIFTNYRFQEKKPKPITRDNRGVKIELNLRVAYNLSGTVAIGEICRIKTNEWVLRKGSTKDWILKFEIEIVGENNKISKIKNPNSFIII